MFNMFKIVLWSMSDTELFATLQIELYRVVGYDSKWSTKFLKGLYVGNFFNLSFKTSFDNIFKHFQNSIRVHVRHKAFATIQVELYRVVDYNSKWSTKFHKDCMLEIF